MSIVYQYHTNYNVWNFNNICKKNIYYLSRSCCALSYFYKICHVATSNHVVSKSHACDSDFIACLHSRNSYYPNSKSALVDVVSYSICLSLKKKKKKKKERLQLTHNWLELFHNFQSIWSMNFVNWNHVHVIIFQDSWIYPRNKYWYLVIHVSLIIIS